jgi:Xaa-Pro aminopeptidase
MNEIRPGDPLDAAIAAFIDEAGLPMSAGELRALLEGVGAAAPGTPVADWAVLVLPHPTPADLDRLEALRRAVAAAPRPLSPPLPERLPDLRRLMAEAGVDAFVVPHADEHQGEYLPARAERLAWLTGFTGSAGMAIVTSGRAAIFVDGRYTLQVRDQVDGTAWEYRHLTSEPPESWLADALPPGGVVGFDPHLAAQGWLDGIRGAVEHISGRLVAVDGNPIDRLWIDQPAAPLGPVVTHDIAYAGRSAADKRMEIAGLLAKDDIDAAVLSAPESLAWLLNIRGADMAHKPLALGFTILHRSGEVEVFIDPRKLTPGLERSLGNGVTLAPPDAFGEALDRLAGKTALLDQQSATVWMTERLARAGAIIRAGADPCALPRARKNETELQGARAAHRRDATAMARFLHRLDDRIAAGTGIDELGATALLRACREEQALFRDDSFDAIAGAGPDGAIVHYRASENSNRRLEPGSLFLIDSGAQYLDGTTDVTRTVAIGTPTAEMRRNFTLVLKGHIAVATARFPRGTTGPQLDTLARVALWRHGLDYDHGTGHGVGSYLGVHEGPASISKRPNVIALEPGMILSNEPGYYKTGCYGIRVENLIAVQEVDIPGAEQVMLGFETLTLVPVDLALIEPSLLAMEERAWVDAYHASVREAVAPTLDAAERQWLERATRPIGG